MLKYTIDQTDLAKSQISATLDIDEYSTYVPGERESLQVQESEKNRTRFPGVERAHIKDESMQFRPSHVKSHTRREDVLPKSTTNLYPMSCTGNQDFSVQSMSKGEVEARGVSFLAARADELIKSDFIYDGRCQELSAYLKSYAYSPRDTQTERGRTTNRLVGQ